MAVEVENRRHGGGMGDGETGNPAKKKNDSFVKVLLGTNVIGIKSFNR